MKILIFYATAGGGHKAAARTIAQEVEALGHQAQIVDGLVGQPKFVQTIFNRGYGLVTDTFPWLWRIMFWVSDTPVLNRLYLPFLWLNYYFLKKAIQEYQPDKIVCTYFGWSPVIQGILKQKNLQTPLFTVVTDKFTAPKIWFLSKKSNYLVFSDRAKQIAQATGISPSQIQTFPDIVDKKYTYNLPNREIQKFKQDQGFDLNKPILLVVGGGESMPKGIQIVRELLDNKVPTQLAVVCGRNSKLKSDLESLMQEYPSAQIKVYGFVDFLYELMNASDLIIAKAGPATVMEALLLEKPLILSHYYWKQELGNVDFVLENQLGFYEPNPQRLAQLTKDLLQSLEQRNRLVKNIQKLSLRTDPADIAKHLVEIRF